MTFNTPRLNCPGSAGRSYAALCVVKRPGSVDLPDNRARTMDANRPTPRNGENVSDGKSYPQQCLSCRTEWRILGSLDENDHRTCPGCAEIEMPTTTYFQWWVMEHFDATIQVEVPSEVSKAVNVLDDVTSVDRRDLLADMITFDLVELVEDE